ncbi:MAG: TlpA family protein disulfide reductase [Proteiniphilum sp.]|jgi:peroxiredoxin|nr:TlpA family protein disulfide reductase [Proteiniphilum sp.]
MFKYYFFCFIALGFVVACNSTSGKNQDSTGTGEMDSLRVAQAMPESSNYQFLVKVGDIAPDFEMQLPEGGSMSLSSLRGKVVMLQFTASWCGVCRKEMPFIESRIWQRHKDHPAFALYGIDREEPAEKIDELRKATNVTYPIGLDPDAGIFGLYAEETAGITRNVIIDRDGKIVMLTRLFEEEEFNRMVETIDQLLLN